MVLWNRFSTGELAFGHFDSAETHETRFCAITPELSKLSHVIKNARYGNDLKLIDPKCGCFTCRNFSWACKVMGTSATDSIALGNFYETGVMVHRRKSVKKLILKKREHPDVKKAIVEIRH